MWRVSLKKYLNFPKNTSSKLLTKIFGDEEKIINELDNRN